MKTELYFTYQPTNRIAERTDALRLCHVRNLPVCSRNIMHIESHPFSAACCRAELVFYI